MKCGIQSEIEQDKNDAEPDCQEGGACLPLTKRGTAVYPRKALLSWPISPL